MAFFTYTVPTPLISISHHSTPYSGTIFSLFGEVELHPSVDTDVTVMGVWYSEDGPHVDLLETASPVYHTNLTFYPLTSSSSGEYTFAVTVQPSGDYLFIVEITNDTSFILEVRGIGLN